MNLLGKCRLLSTLILLTLSLSAFAETKEQCTFSLDCEMNGKTFSLEFRSPSNDCAEDDMVVSFKSQEKAQDLSLKPKWYFYTDHIAKSQPSICKGADMQVNAFAAYVATPKSAILFVKASGRPGYDRVSAILLDSVEGKVLDSADLGQTKNNSVAVLKTKNGFKTRIIRDSLSFHKEVACDCDAPFVDDWKSVSVRNNKIKSSWVTK